MACASLVQNRTKAQKGMVINMKKQMVLLLAAVCLLFGGCGRKALPAAEWFDYYATPHDMPELSEPLEFEAEEYDGVVFCWKNSASQWGDDITAVRDGEETLLYSGMPVWSVFLSDLNGDGYRELCSTVSVGSGMVDSRIIVYDYRAGKQYELADRGEYDYVLALRDGVLTVSKREWNSREELASGPLGLERENDETLLCMKEEK